VESKTNCNINDVLYKHTCIIAEDFTGACDTGICFHTLNNQVRISIDIKSPWDASLDENVVQVFLSDTRKYPPQKASEIAYEVAKKLDDFGDSINLYQKIDSTMRGNSGIEIESILNAIKGNVAVLCPAFPDMGRTILNGQLLVNNVLISKTAYANDPRNPIHFDKLANIVRETNKTIEIKETGAHNLEKVIEEQLIDMEHKSIIIVDAQTNDDLKDIAQILLRFPNVLPVGSAGLASQLSKIWTMKEKETNSKVIKPTIEQIIVASGSANPCTHKQLSVLESNEDISLIYVDVNQLINELAAKKEINRVKQVMLKQSKHNKIIGIALSAKRVEITRSDDNAFAIFIGKLVSYYMKVSNKKLENIGIVVAGADTSVAVCNFLDIHTVWPQHEVVKGIEYSLGNNRYHMISKAGGFGNEDALVESVHFFLNN